ncbi:hypothetical protein [Lewinella sp. JB7]|uniref:hypothetical protein n=1 Tax=Lewinella sp. JB7 TaxID=2962887 RepID=UPI0020C99251|nr:hypothetical protein [Lewinella sp. JB7]MCP9236695.1 hypothetical protein [Lewinella sp. JB7]
MTTDALLKLLRSLHGGSDPLTGTPVPTDSCLHDSVIRSGLDDLIRTVSDHAPTPHAPSAREVEELCDALRTMDYAPTVQQLARIFTGSRSIADPRLRGLPAYRRYRGVLSRRALEEILGTHPPLSTKSASAKTGGAGASEGWREIDFFTTDAFDKLSSDKAEELRREIAALGMRKPTDRLPAYMARARATVARAFEPWTREEKALLIEAMCYTNDSERLATIFERSPASVRRTGQQLIYRSQKKEVA